MNRVIKNLPKQSKESQSFFKMWDKNWNKLIDNPYYRLVKNLDIDLSEMHVVLDNCVCYFYQESEFEHRRNEWKSIEEAVSKCYKGEQLKLVLFAYKGYADYINSYLGKHNIKLINTERDEWKTMRFMSHFLGDFKSDKVVFWHERSDNESGEFVQCDLSFVKKCLKYGNMPELPKIKIPNEWKKIAKACEVEEDAKSESVQAKANKIYRILESIQKEGQNEISKCR